MLSQPARSNSATAATWPIADCRRSTEPLKSPRSFSYCGANGSASSGRQVALSKTVETAAEAGDDLLVGGARGLALRFERSAVGIAAAAIDRRGEVELEHRRLEQRCDLGGEVASPFGAEAAQRARDALFDHRRGDHAEHAGECGVGPARRKLDLIVAPGARDGHRHPLFAQVVRENCSPIADAVFAGQVIAAGREPIAGVAVFGPIPRDDRRRRLRGGRRVRSTGPARAALGDQPPRSSCHAVVPRCR